MNPNLQQQDLIPKKLLSEKHSYVHYLSYTTLVSYVAFVGAVLFKLQCRDIVIGFSAEHKNAQLQNPKNIKKEKKKSLSTVTEIS